MTEVSRKSASKETECPEIPVRAADGQYLSALHPKYLHTNSTSHTWPFSAVAELIDNAYDPDVNASQLLVDVKLLKNQFLLVFTDNGSGMTPNNLYKMVSFGFSEKVALGDHLPVGQYGNGFKSGSMRLGKDALVFTKRDNRLSLGFLSQTYLEKINSKTIIVPLVTWEAKKFTLLESESGGRKSLIQIFEHSVVSTMAEVKEEFKQIPGTSGTRIIIYNLRRHSGGIKYELDFTTDSNDIRIPDDLSDTDEARYKREQRQDHIPASDYSLRAYCSILYLKPRMQIILRGQKVKTTVIAKSLAKTEVDLYKPNTPSGYAKPVRITFGFSQNKNHYGIMMYNRNRLIKPYVRVGYQLKPNSLGVGVIGVIECDFLQPTHNKQDFDQSKAFRACMAGLGRKLNEYWQEKKGSNKQAANQPPSVEENENEVLLPDQKWVQCDNMKCLKWRVLPDDTNLDLLPDKWFCKDHPTLEWRSCDIPEKLEDDHETITPYKKEVSKLLKKEQQQKRKQTENSAKLANELQQMVEKKDQELAEEKRKRSHNEMRAKAHEQEIKRLKLELEKTKTNEVKSPRDAPPSSNTTPSCKSPNRAKSAAINSVSLIGSASLLPKSGKPGQPPATQQVSLLISSPNLAAATTSVLTASIVSSPDASASPVASRPTRQSINQAIKVRLPFTTRRPSLPATPGQIPISSVQASVSKPIVLAATVSGSQGSSLAATRVTSVVSTNKSSSVLARIQPKPGVLAKQVIALTTTKPSGVVTPQGSPGASIAPKVYRLVVTDPSRMRPGLSSNSLITQPSTVPSKVPSTVPAKVPKMERTGAADGNRAADKTVSINSIGKPLPTSRDISQQLAQIGIDAIAAQAEMMVPSMAIAATPSVTNMASSVSEKLMVGEAVGNPVGTNSSMDTRGSNASTTMSKSTRIADDDVQIIDVKSKNMELVVKAENGGEISNPCPKETNTNGTESVVTKRERDTDTVSNDVSKNVDKDLIEDIKRIPEGKVRNFLMQRSQQLRDLRKSICQLLGLLVPDLNLPQPGKMPLDDNTIDVLLRDVLDANRDSKAI